MRVASVQRSLGYESVSQNRKSVSYLQKNMPANDVFVRTQNISFKGGYERAAAEEFIEKIEKGELNEEFMNVLKVLSSNMLAGYSVENAWQEAEKEMELMYGNDSLMLSEIQEMNRQIKMNQTFEAVLSEFAHRSGLEDIVNFSDIFSFAKRSGGRFVDIIESTTYRMWTKYDTNRQIEVAVSAKRLEQKTMNYIPIFLLAFLKLSSRDYMSALYGNLIGVIFMSTCLLAYAGAIKLAKKFLQVGIGI